MSLEGDARPARQSSSLSALRVAFGARVRAFGRLAFAGFVGVHFAFQAFRASGDGTRPEPGLEAQPWFVATLLLVIGVPFALFAGRELQQVLSGLPARDATQRARALAVAERLSLVLVLLFAIAHCTQIAWPLLSGSAVAADVRPGLILSLSSTSHGMPLQASFYVCGVAAASFYAARQALAAVTRAPRPAPRLARAVVALGALAYVLGSYAVIRCASGDLLP